MNEKEQQLTFEKGITNVPSDALCSDNALEQETGLIYRNGEHHVIQAPAVFGSFSNGQGENPTLLYVHKYDDHTRFIAAYTYEDDTHQKKTVYGHYQLVGATIDLIGTLGRSGRTDTLFYEEGSRLTSIGKTLIVTDSKGPHFFIWKNDGYSKEFTDMPVPDVEFRLTGINDQANIVKEYGDSGNMLENRGGVYHLNPLHKEEWNNLIVGLYSKLKKDLHQKKRFWGNFSVRVALRLYDGSYYHISPPIMMMNQFAAMCVGDIQNAIVTMTMHGQQLQFKNNTDLSDWQDIVSELVVFASREVDNFDTASDALCDLQTETLRTFYTITGNKKNMSTDFTDNKYKVLNNIEEESMKSLVENGVFYELCSIGTEEVTSWTAIDNLISTQHLETLEARTQLQMDDYFGHTRLAPDYIYAYNSRLNMANVARSMFEGFSYFLPYDSNEEHEYDLYVKIATDNGVRVVHKGVNTAQKQGLWFFYPDTRANHVTIYKDDTCILDTELHEHPALHGAYYFKGVLTDGDDEPSGGVPTMSESDIDTTPERLPNYIILSEVNNPFVVKAEGYYKVSTGKILAISSLTQALSQGQFGQYPLLVFSETGIWALSVGSTGLYTQTHPMSRDVCSNAGSITQTDGEVYFVSKKGLMVVQGNAVVCVSEQMGGRTSANDGAAFTDYLQEAIIAYDYRDSLLWIFKAKDGGSPKCYVYSIKSRTYSAYDFGNESVSNVQNNYPDYLLQTGNKVYTLLQRADANEDATLYAANLVTRPMKLENALALKSIMQVRHIGDLSGSMTLRVFASNNLRKRVELKSLRGVPWKYYRFSYSFSGLKATDTFAGTMVVTQERRTNKMR